MFEIIKSTYVKNRITRKRAYPWTYLLGRLFNALFSILIPYLIYKFMFDGKVTSSFVEYTDSSDYITFIVLGIAINILGIATLMNIGRALITELREGTIGALLISPASRAGYFIGCQIEQISYTIMQFGIVVVLGSFFGAKVSRILTFESIIIILIILFSFFALGVLLSSIMLKTRDTYITQNTLFMILYIISGVAFPIEYLPKSIQFISEIIPMTASLKLYRAVVLLEEKLVNNMHLVVQILALSIIYLVIGIYFNKKMEKNIMNDIFG
ncbi:ABC transporter permease [Clostridiaceae bacterium M8S5]|nr:ABC transporter permease [Clostridiaceae bacterium M8S5]